MLNTGRYYRMSLIQVRLKVHIPPPDIVALPTALGVLSGSPPSRDFTKTGVLPPNLEQQKTRNSVVHMFRNNRNIFVHDMHANI